MQKLTFIGIAALAAMLLALAPTALAGGSKDGDGVVKRGKCTASSTWKLKVKSDDGRIETEFEVDQNRVGKRWRVTLTVAARTSSAASAPPWLRAGLSRCVVFSPRRQAQRGSLRPRRPCRVAKAAALSSSSDPAAIVGRGRGANAPVSVFQTVS